MVPGAARAERRCRCRDAQVGVDERGQPGHVLLSYGVALGFQLVDGGIEVDGRLEGGAVEDEAEGAELIF